MEPDPRIRQRELKTTSSQSRFVCIGEALFDLIPAQCQSQPNDMFLRLQPGGAPLNVAVTLARLGHAVTFCGVLSQDPLGQRLRSIVAAEKIELTIRDAVPAQTRLALVDHAAGNGAFRFYGDQPADSWIRSSDVERALANANGIYVSSLMMIDERPRAVQLRAIEIAHSRGIPIFCDPNPRPPAWLDHAEMHHQVRELLGASTVTKLSTDDLKILGFDTDPAAAIQEISEQYRCELVITDGARGSWAMFEGEAVQVPTKPLEVVDPTGAGDVFVGALIAKYLEDDGLSVEALRFANAAGSLATTRAGAIAAIPDRATVEQLVEIES